MPTQNISFGASDTTEDKIIPQNRFTMYPYIAKHNDNAPKMMAFNTIT